MIGAVVFDMFETLVTHYRCPLYFGEQIAADLGISNEEFQVIWESSGESRTIGLFTLEDVLERIMREHHLYSECLLKKLLKRGLPQKNVALKTYTRRSYPCWKQ